MAKKGNTLNDLTKFLAAEQKVVLEQPDINHESFLEKEPVSLIDIHQDIPISILEIKSEDIPKFIDSDVLRKTSFDEVNELIKTLALDNKLSVQQVLFMLYYRSILPYSITNWVDWSNNIHKSYLLFMNDFQKNWWKK
jgi:hypothetical protein